jgi:TPR repeat protein
MATAMPVSCRLKSILPAAWFTAAALSAFPLPHAAAAKALSAIHDGVHLSAAAPDPGRKFDVEIVGPRNGLKRLVDALELIARKSPHGAAGIARLKTVGEIHIVYDPNFPRREQDLGSIRRALFVPTFFGADGPKGPARFPVVVSRHGINARAELLSAILVHELVGHGIQQAEGRTATARERELECEAWLHEEWAYQEFGVDKLSDEMVNFRRQLEGSSLPAGRATFRRTTFLRGRSGTVGSSQEGHCSPFKRYLAEHAPDELAHFEKLNPDVPRLLAALKDYVAYLEKSGITNAALDARAAFQAEQLDDILAAGTPEEQYRVALALKAGQGLPQDDSRAAQFFERAAKQGYADAQYRIALAYAEGDGVAEDAARAADWYAKAAAQNHPAAQRDLGRLYEFGRGVGRDAGKAAEWYRAAAESGDAAGQNNYAIFLLTGRGGIAKDAARAAEFLALSVEQEFAPAYLNLAKLHAAGIGVEPDRVKAAELYTEAADNGDAAAQYELGRAHLNGHGVERNAAKAEELLIAAADQGHAESRLALARMYRRGLGVPRDEARAATLLRAAASQGNAEAQGLYATVLAGGRGVVRDPTEAYFWAGLAAREEGRTRFFARNIQAGLEKELSAAQIAEAERKILAWRPGTR